MNIGAKIQFLIDKNKETRPILAEALGVSTKTVGHWITNRNEPSCENLVKIANRYNIPVGYFFDEVELNGKDLNNALIDKIIDDLIEEGVLNLEQSFESLDAATQQILIGALNKHINKIIKDKDSNQ